MTDKTDAECAKLFFFFSDSNAARRQSLILRWTNSFKQKEKWIHITVLLMFTYKLLTNEPVEKKVPANLKTVQLLQMCYSVRQFYLPIAKRINLVSVSRIKSILSCLYHQVCNRVGISSYELTSSQLQFKFRKISSAFLKRVLSLSVES